MKIAMVGGLAGPGAAAGGVWAVAKEQSRALLRSDHDVSLLGGWLGAPPAEAGTTLMELHRPFPGAGLRGLYSLRAGRMLRDFVRDADLVHVHLSRDFLTSTTLPIAAALNLPIVAQAHGMITPATKPTTKAFDYIWREKYLRHVSIWLALTEVEREGLMAFGVERSRILPIHNAVSEPPNRWSDESGDPKRFAFISRLHKRKQPDVFVAAALQAFDASEDVSFTVAGPDQGALRQVEDAISARPRAFDILGPLNEREVQAELLRSTALVLPSRGEVAPMIAIEAAALGMPIILTSDCGLAALFDERQAAIIVEPSVESVAEAMRAVAESSALRAELSCNARRLYEDQWSSASLATELLEAYERARGVA